ncbi:GHKL domain-containing protein [Leifsonia sp. ZF2019]|uniref:sensor histidine kinase n=1 Tax=Leifsonia sp. ZF2019 TaxID=2781978 RepID=UPI001CBB64A1|nr:ATP-binding protein [Leifsonia sp. ZF2019]UAJ80256.1 GHKL domain-containing protein [Leifsonia sp. ZF2019]
MARRGVMRSAASRVFAVLVAVVLVAGALTAVLLVLDAQRSARTEAERVTRSVSQTLAELPEVASALTAGPHAATAELEPVTERVTRSAGVDFITIMTTEGIRVTHPDPEQIGRHYLGTIPATPVARTEEFTGTLGPSVRTIAPVLDGRRQVGWVATGVTVESIGSTLLPRIPYAIGIALAVTAAGVVGALVVRRLTRRVTGDLPAREVRDAVSSYDSVRTLGEALRAQNHEHGNRMHTAVALIELGRTDEAVELLTETSRQSQALVDQVTAARAGDPTVGALLLGKAAQAAERGVDWEAVLDPDTPRTSLSAVDAVSVVGNLIDNALDAAAAGPDPRWVRFTLARAEGGGVVMEVADSGDGVPPDVRGRIFEPGFSTKPAAEGGRGVGLPLVKAIVEGAGGTLSLDAHPTRFRAELPGRRIP